MPSTMYAAPGATGSGLSASTPGSFANALAKVSGNGSGLGTVVLAAGTYSLSDIPVYRGTSGTTDDFGLTHNRILSKDITGSETVPTSLLIRGDSYSSQAVFNLTGARPSYKEAAFLLGEAFNDTLNPPFDTTAYVQLSSIELKYITVKGNIRYGINSSMKTKVSSCKIDGNKPGTGDNSGIEVGVNIYVSSYGTRKPNDTELLDNDIRNCQKNNVLVEGANNLTAEGNQLYDPNKGGYSTGDQAASIKIQRVSGAVVRDNYVNHNGITSATHGIWVDIQSGTDSSFRNNGENYIVDNTCRYVKGFAILYEISTNGIITLNDTDTCTNGIKVDTSSYCEVVKNNALVEGGVALALREARRYNAGGTEGHGVGRELTSNLVRLNLFGRSSGATTYTFRYDDVKVEGTTTYNPARSLRGSVLNSMNRNWWSLPDANDEFYVEPDGTFTGGTFTFSEFKDIMDNATQYFEYDSLAKTDGSVPSLTELASIGSTDLPTRTSAAYSYLGITVQTASNGRYYVGSRIIT